MSLLAILQIGCVVAFALLLVAAGWQDLRTMRIGNGLSISIMASFALWSAAGLALGQFSLVYLCLAVACAAAVFAVAFAGFAAGALGGGDVKLLAAASLFAGPADHGPGRWRLGDRHAGGRADRPRRGSERRRHSHPLARRLALRPGDCRWRPLDRCKPRDRVRPGRRP